MNTADVHKKTFEVLSKQLKVSINQISEEKRLSEDLGADSMNRAECVMYLEEVFNITINDVQALQLLTVQDIINCVLKKIEEKNLLNKR